jgi:hypothetical protein
MSFYDVISDAINDIIAHGYDSRERIDKWLEKIKKAAQDKLISEKVLAQKLRDYYTLIFKRIIKTGGYKHFHVQTGPKAFTIKEAKLTAAMKEELDRRILSAANLIKLNREEAIRDTLKRFEGWSTAIPAGGTRAQGSREAQTEIKSSIASLSFRERRVLIDQGHKLMASINDIIAEGNGAIAAKWHSNYRQMNYNYREEHRERDGHVYLIRGSWADKAGLVKPKPGDGYTDQHEMPGEFVFCRCAYVYVYGLDRLPEEMLTEKGKARLKAAREEVG